MHLPPLPPPPSPLLLSSESSAETEAELGVGSEPTPASDGGLEPPPDATAITLPSPPPTDDNTHQSASRPRKLSGAGSAGAVCDACTLTSAWAQLSSLHIGRDWPVITQVRRDGGGWGASRHHAGAEGRGCPLTSRRCETTVVAGAPPDITPLRRRLLSPHCCFWCVCVGVHADVPRRVGRPQPDCDDCHGRRTGQV